MLCFNIESQVFVYATSLCVLCVCVALLLVYLCACGIGMTKYDIDGYAKNANQGSGKILENIIKTKTNSKIPLLFVALPQALLAHTGMLSMKEDRYSISKLGTLSYDKSLACFAVYDGQYVFCPDTLRESTTNE